MFWKITNNFLWGLSTLATFLLFVNLASLYFLGVEGVRVIRLLSVAALFAFFYFKTERIKLSILFVLSLFFIREFFLVYYESTIGHSFYLIVGIAAYTAICYERREIIKKIIFNPTSFIISALLIGSNAFTIYKLSEIILSNGDSFFSPTLFYVYGALMISLSTIAVTYNNSYNSDRSLLFIFLAFCFIISDISSLFAYYFDFSFLYYIEKVAFFIGMSIFVYFGSNTVIEREEQLQIEAFELLK